MLRRNFALALLATAALLGLLMAAPCHWVTGPEAAGAALPTASSGTAAIEKAAKSDKYLFLFFWKENNRSTRTMKGVFDAAMAGMADEADGVVVHVADRAEKKLVDKFDVRRAPMPLVLAVAPNGAITKGFPLKFNEKELREAFVSPCTAKCMKALQDRKLVLLCVQSEKTQYNQAAMKGVQGFKADKRFAEATEIVTLNPDDPSEEKFLTGLRVNPKTSAAVTVLLAPPGPPIATFTGAVSKDQLVAKVASAQSGPCAGGQCGPGGCCPPKK